MVGYRRNFVPGGTYFFTVALKNRSSSYLTEHVDLLINGIKTVQKRTRFNDIACVVMPDHMHTIWRLPEEDSDYPMRWKAIKSLFTRSLIKSGVDLAKTSRGEYPLWQRRYWEHTISGMQDLRSHIDYIHYNPVKHGYVSNACDWPYSSLHRYIRQGLLPQDWGGRAPSYPKDVNYGE